MDIGSIGKQSAIQLTRMPAKNESSTKKAVVSDGFQKGSLPEALDADRMKNLQAGRTRGAGRSLAVNKAICIGAAFAGILTGAAVGGPFAPALMISFGALFGGAAILSLK